MQTRTRYRPGQVRDEIVKFLSGKTLPETVSRIHAHVVARLGDVPRSSVQSYLGNNQPFVFTKVRRGEYILSGSHIETSTPTDYPYISVGKATLFNGDSFKVLDSFEDHSFEAVVTDPPYGVVEYSKTQLSKLRNSDGGIWRIPPSFDGVKRSPLPRFTTLKPDQLESIRDFFERLGGKLDRILVPGGHAIIASNPLVSYLVTDGLVRAGLENRGSIVRKVITMRGGDRPKNAHEEFSDVSVMPRSAWEPWVLVRKPLDGRVQDNLRKWNTGGLRRISDDRPFFDVIPSHPTQKREKAIAPHPSLKPQKLMREIVRASLPLQKGRILDPFSGSGATLAAANRLGFESVGIELDRKYFESSKGWIQQLQEID